MTSRMLWEDVFHDSDTTKMYLEICRRTTTDKDSEVHHILPKSLFPEYARSTWNLARLSYEDHYKAHELLPEMCVDDYDRRKMIHALWCISHNKNTREFVSENDYALTRRLYRTESMGDNHPCKGKTLSEETKAKISAKALGRKLSEETKRKISIAVKARPPCSDAERANRSKAKIGKKMSDQARANMSAAKRLQSVETRRKIADAHTGTKASLETRAKLSECHKGNTFASKYSFLCYTPEGHFVKAYQTAESLRDAGFAPANVRAVCNGAYGCKTHKGFIWKKVPKTT